MRRFGNGLGALGDGWTLDGNAIRKQYTLDGFPAAIAFVTRLAFTAEAADHHPDILINYKRVTLTFSTHSEGGLTEKDFAGRARGGRTRVVDGHMELKNTYSSREVAAMTGLTARQLQWWDAKRLFASHIAAHKTDRGGYTERRYTPVDLLELLVLADCAGRASRWRSSAACS
jgi:4a-hydroxytetrahydrobiopterin dehydratase